MVQLGLPTVSDLKTILKYSPCNPEAVTEAFGCRVYHTPKRFCTLLEAHEHRFGGNPTTLRWSNWVFRLFQISKPSSNTAHATQKQSQKRSGAGSTIHLSVFVLY